MTMKVAVIGLDGVCWSVLDRVFEHEAMPFLKELVKKSARGILKSTVPPITPPAWTSIATGVNPGKHGVFDFVTSINGYETRIVNALDVKYPRIHEMVTLKHLKSVCINLTLTYPTTFKNKNCRIISDWLAPQISYYPHFLKKYISDYPTHTPISSYKSKTDIVQGLLDEATARTKVTLSLLEKVDWDLFWMVYNESDHILHTCYTDVLNGNRTALKIFKTFDQTIRKATEIADLIIVISDHGFSKFRYFVNINSFLNRLGLITQTWNRTMKQFSDFKIDVTTKRHRMPQKIYKIVSIKPIKIIIKKIYKTITGKDVKAELPYVNPATSRAFMSSSMSLGVHVKDQLLTEFIVKKLEKLAGISHVWRREEIYHGPFIKNSPEILFLPDFNNGYSVGTVMLHPKIITEKIGFWHHPDGIVMIFGKGVTPTLLRKVETFDIVPTILRYMNLPIPKDTDGNLISNIEYPRKNVKRYDYLKHWQLIRQVQTRRTMLLERLNHKRD